MEFIEILTIIVALGAIAVILVKVYQGKSKVKGKKTSANEQLNEVLEDTIKRQAIELKKQVGRANRFQALYQNEQAADEEVTDEEPATWEQIGGLVKLKFPQYEKYLSNPAIKYYVMDKFKGMSLNEIIKEIEPLIGDIKSQSGTNPNELQNNSTFA